MAKKIMHKSQYITDHKLVCGKCGASGMVQPLYIVVSNEHDLCSDKLIRNFEYGKPQSWTCNKCGTEMTLRGPITYLNTANKLFLHPVLGRDYDEEEKKFKYDITRIFKENGVNLTIGSGGEFSYDGYQARICRSYIDFTEKICIARYSKNDKVMEIVKYYLKYDFLPREYNTKDVKVRWFQGSGFKLKNGLPGIQFRIIVSGKEYDMNVPEEVYNSAYAALDEWDMITDENQGFYVDESWASVVYPKISRKITKIMTTEEYNDMIAAQKRAAAAATAAASASRQASSAMAAPRTNSTYRPIYHPSTDESSYSGSSYSGSAYNEPSYSSSYSSSSSEPNASAQRYNYERAMSEGGSDGYRTATVDGQTVYYSGEYRPCGSSGESYHYEEGMTPMTEY